ncbi:DUF1344 domain-containing protein [Cypionkella sp.]|jgi:hypothetical protein|uniref:DUF1344 domain-containing protein n=1 Tax=Cypionkella sp. TaxID=2811411 RepID=UPI00271E422A|nr:DUF1344 domain-containing protein [Cypionkella sp.]MDO8985331.1 DUF1344 domain-containing protein [Cypionkella sp.]MDP1575245.1 DUF1344 domain-containing protein [Cypionkella sp.]MDP2048450.1 DUF1344 domain-containing protein [Cypionkella sp.]
MRAFMLPAAIILSLGSASLAMAAPTTTDGVIKSLDMKTHTITLADGTAYMLPKGFKDPGLKVGEKVAVVWDLKGKIHEASAVSIVKS